MRNPEIRSLLNLTHAALSLLPSPSFCLPFLLSSSHLSILIPCGHSFSSSLKVKVSPSSEVWWQQGFELHATEFWEICNFEELLIGLPLVLFGHEMSQSPLTGLQRPLPKGTGTGRLLSLPLQNYASFPDAAPSFALRPPEACVHAGVWPWAGVVPTKVCDGKHTEAGICTVWLIGFYCQGSWTSGKIKKTSS